MLNSFENHFIFGLFQQMDTKLEKHGYELW
jgi:hypothetical protein